MSKRTDLVKAHPITRLIGQVSFKNDWGAQVESEADYIFCQLRLTHQHLGSQIVIRLREHGKLPVYMVEQFDPIKAVGNPELATGNDLFDYYGKRFSDAEDVFENDIRQLWTIGCAKDLAAIMRSYDYVAQLYGRPALFNLPPQD